MSSFDPGRLSCFCRENIIWRVSGFGKGINWWGFEWETRVEEGEYFVEKEEGEVRQVAGNQGKRRWSNKSLTG